MARIQKNRDLLDSRKVSEKNIDERINHVTSDPIMADILKDTASTTLMSQGISNNASQTSPRPADAAARAVADNSLEDLFEGSQNWAALAFEKPSKK